jgi:putative membrane protein
MPTGRRDLLLAACVGTAGLWIVSLAGTLFPSQLSSLFAYEAQETLLFLFVVLHASLSNGWRGALAFALIGLAAGFGLEAVNQIWGFPFGFVTHNTPGPKPFGVPLSVGVTYMINGWPAWVMARLIVRRQPDDVSALSLLATPIIASFILVSVDYPFDPIGGTVFRTWTYHSPSGQFGVPLSNFLGWLLTGWLIFQLFALIEPRFSPRRPARSKLYWLLPSIVWIAQAMAFIPWFLAAPEGQVSAGGRTFLIADIYEAGLIAAILTMLPPALAAAFRILTPSGSATETRHG